jgi:hypothetical protein
LERPQDQSERELARVHREQAHIHREMAESERCGGDDNPRSDPQHLG